MKIVNDAGGDQGPQGPLRRRGHRLQGRPVGRGLQEDHRPEQGQPLLRRFDRLREDDQSRAGPQGHDPDGAARPSRTELNDPTKYPLQFMVGPDYTEMFGILLRVHRQDEARAPRWRSSTPTPSSAATRSTRREALAAKLGSGRREDRHAAGQRRRLDRNPETAPRRSRLHDLPRLRVGADPGIHDPGQAARHEEPVHGHLLDRWTTRTVQKMGEAARRLHGRRCPTATTTTRKARRRCWRRSARCAPEYQSTAYMQGFLTAMLFTRGGQARARGRASEFNGSEPEDGAQHHQGLRHRRHHRRADLDHRQLDPGRPHLQGRMQAEADGAGLRLDQGLEVTADP